MDYFEQVARLIGAAAGLPRAASLARAQEFIRLFLVPGMGHCGGGPGCDNFDTLTALERWVEDDEPPVGNACTREQQPQPAALSLPTDIGVGRFWRRLVRRQFCLPVSLLIVQIIQWEFGSCWRLLPTHNCVIHIKYIPW